MQHQTLPPFLEARLLGRIWIGLHPVAGDTDVEYGRHSVGFLRVADADYEGRHRANKFSVNRMIGAQLVRYNPAGVTAA